MSNSVKNLVDALKAEDAIAAKDTFESIVGERVFEKLESMKIQMSNKITEAVNLNEKVTPEKVIQHMVKQGHNKARVTNLVKKNFASVMKAYPDATVSSVADRVFDDDHPEASNYRRVNEEQKSGGKEEYEKFFQDTLKKFDVKSPQELDKEKRKEFFDYINKNWKAKDEEANLDEISKKTLGSYIRKSADDMVYRKGTTRDKFVKGKAGDDAYNKNVRKYAVNRPRGIDRATSRLTREDVESVNESLQKAGQALDKYAEKLGSDNMDYDDYKQHAKLLMSRNPKDHEKSAKALSKLDTEPRDEILNIVHQHADSNMSQDFYAKAGFKRIR